jgi:DNA-binding protein HU-beta|uniref:DNA-binding protein hu homolog n=1 Tax=Cryptomonas gyropyrenoidosa TaxID=233257 RepID=UPI00279A3D3F|nr:DNA-binding protein hu homolog [Cryptomonas gyropyrenoidosa]WFQ82996.1 DNA-binding protein hu homolog [Cryptomonas gyropyrenoidosa]
MNKKELISSVANVSSMSKTDVNHVLEAILEIIIVTVSNGEVVRLVGFGSFCPILKDKEIHTIRNAKQSVSHTSLRGVRFSIGKFFKQKMYTST